MTDKVHVVVAIPSLGSNPMLFTYSVAGLIAMYSSGRSVSLPGTQVEITVDISASSNLIGNRETLVGNALQSDATHLLFLDDDMAFQPLVLDSLLSRKVPIVMVNYLQKRDGIHWVAHRNGHPVETLRSMHGIEEVDYCGFGVSLFELEVFRQTPRPWFMQEYSPEHGTMTTEDVAFFRRARKAGFTPYIDHNASKMVGHVGQWVWSWEQAS